MKYVITLAFLAVAMAEQVPVPEPIRLASPEEPEVVQFAPISMLPLYVPDDVLQAFQQDLEINPPTYNDEIAPSPVIVVDSPPQDFEYEPVKFVDSPLEDFEATAVKFVDSPPEDAVQDIVPSPVNFVDVADEVAPVDQVKVLVADVPEFKAEEIEPSAVNFVESAPEETFAYSSVKIVNSAEGDRPFQFANPYLR